MKISYLIIALLCFIILFYIGSVIPILTPKIVVVLTVALIFSVLTLMNPEIGLYLLIFVVPFTQQITLGRLGRGLVDVGTDDILIIFILLSWLANLARSKEPIFLKTTLNWPLAAFFAVSIFSFIGAHRLYGMPTVIIGILHLFKFFEYVAVYFIVVSTIKSFDQIKRFLYMFFIVAGLIALLQLSAIYIWGHFRLPQMPWIAPSEIPTILAPGGYRTQIHLAALHLFMTSAVLGAYYAIFISIVLAMILNKPVFDKVKVYLILFALVLSFALFNSFSRSAYLGLIVSLLVLAALKEKRLFLVVLMLLVLSPIYMQSAVLERITFTVQSLQPFKLDPSSFARLELWKKSVDIFSKHIFFGTGYWSARYVLGGYEAHSQYLAILVETGLVGFSVFCWLITRMFKNAIILMKKANVDLLKSLGLGYIAGLAAILAICIFGEILEALRIIAPLWFITGLVTSANRLLAEGVPEGGIGTKKLDIDST